MTVFKLKPDANRFRNLVVDEERDWDRFEVFDGHPFTGKWKPVRVREARSEGRSQGLPAGDFPALLGRVPVFTSRARSALSGLIDGAGQWFPLLSDLEDYWALNVLDVRNALDRERSLCELFDDGTVMRVERYVFHPDQLRGATIFKLVETLRMEVFVTEPFVAEVQSHGLLGFRFEEV